MSSYGVIKRFVAFVGVDHYPSGGMDDFIGSFETLSEAVEAVHSQLASSDGGWPQDWGHVVDLETGVRTDVESPSEGDK